MSLLLLPPHHHPYFLRSSSIFPLLFLSFFVFFFVTPIGAQQQLRLEDIMDRLGGMGAAQRMVKELGEPKNNDPLRKVFSIWGRLLNRMAQQNPPSDDELHLKGAQETTGDGEDANNLISEDPEGGAGTMFPPRGGIFGGGSGKSGLGTAPGQPRPPSELVGPDRIIDEQRLNAILPRLNPNSKGGRTTRTGVGSEGTTIPKTTEMETATTTATTATNSSSAATRTTKRNGRKKKVKRKRADKGDRNNGTTTTMDGGGQMTSHTDTGTIVMPTTIAQLSTTELATTPKVPPMSILKENETKEWEEKGEEQKQKETEEGTKNNNGRGKVEEEVLGMIGGAGLNETLLIRMENETAQLIAEIENVLADAEMGPNAGGHWLRQRMIEEEKHKQEEEEEGPKNGTETGERETTTMKGTTEMPKSEIKDVMETPKVETKDRMEIQKPETKEAMETPKTETKEETETQNPVSYVTTEKQKMEAKDAMETNKAEIKGTTEMQKVETATTKIIGTTARNKDEDNTSNEKEGEEDGEESEGSDESEGIEEEEEEEANEEVTEEMEGHPKNRTEGEAPKTTMEGTTNKSSTVEMVMSTVTTEPEGTTKRANGTRNGKWIPEAEEEEQQQQPMAGIAQLQLDPNATVSSETTTSSSTQRPQSAQNIFNLNANANSNSHPNISNVMRPVNSIIDGIGPLILPLIGYSQRAFDAYAPYAAQRAAGVPTFSGRVLPGEDTQLIQMSGSPRQQSVGPTVQRPLQLPASPPPPGSGPIHQPSPPPTLPHQPLPTPTQLSNNKLIWPRQMPSSATPALAPQAPSLELLGRIIEQRRNAERKTAGKEAEEEPKEQQRSRIGGKQPYAQEISGSSPPHAEQSYFPPVLTHLPPQPVPVRPPPIEQRSTVDRGYDAGRHIVQSNFHEDSGIMLGGGGGGDRTGQIPAPTHGQQQQVGSAAGGGGGGFGNGRRPTGPAAEFSV